MSIRKHNDHPQTGAPGCLLDRLVRFGMTAAREEEMLQLVNDLAENMNMRRWKRADLIQCINWQGWLLVEAAEDKSKLRTEIMRVIIGDISKPNDLPQPQPPGSQAPMKVWSSESPADAEKKRDGGC